MCIFYCAIENYEIYDNNYILIRIYIIFIYLYIYNTQMMYYKVIMHDPMSYFLILKCYA